MKIFENYTSAKQKYGEIAETILKIGIPNEYVYLACRFHIEENIPLNTLKLEFKQWMAYIRNQGKETFNVNTLTYSGFKGMINHALQKAMRPNPIYDDGTVFLGEFKTKEDALLYPIPNEWCTSNSSNKFNQYVKGGYRLFIIENKTLDEPLKYVCASVFKGNVAYWDVNDIKQCENLAKINDITNEHENYQKTLPKQIIQYLYDIAAKQTEEMERSQINCNRKFTNKIIVRLTESDLYNIISESIKDVLNECDFA